MHAASTPEQTGPPEFRPGQRPSKKSEGTNRANPIKLVLRAQDTTLCKVFQRGQRVTFCLRNVLLEQSDAVCAYQCSLVRSYLLALERSHTPRNILITLRGNSLLCLDADCMARFEVEVLHAENDGDTPPQQGCSDPAPLTRQDPRKRAHSSSAKPTDAPGGVLPFGAAPESFLAQLPEAHARQLIAAGTLHHHHAGETIIHQGITGTRIFLIADGTVCVEKRMDDGTDIELARLGPGECFGEMSLLTGEPCSASVTAIEPAAIYSIKADRFEELMAKTPALHRTFSQLFADRLRTTDVQLEKELARGMTGRLSMISLLEIVQTLSLSNQTGRLCLHRNGHAFGLIHLEKGQIRAALCGNAEGEDAIRALVRCTDGVFSFRKEDTSTATSNVTRSTINILLDATREWDEHQG